MQNSSYDPYFCRERDRQSVSSTRKGVIFFFVLTIHILVGFLPLVCQLYSQWANPPDKVFVDKVVLVDSAPNDNTIPSLHPGKAPQPSNDPPAPPKTLEPLPELPDPEPEPVTPPPAPKPIPQPTPQPVVKPVPKQVEIPKTPDPKAPAIPKPTIKPPKKQPKKVQPKSPTEEEIRREIERQRYRRYKARKKAAQQKRTSQTTRTPRTVQQGQGQNQALKDLAKELKGIADGVPGGTGTGTPGGAGGPKGEYDPTMDSYYARVGAYLRARWVNRPSLSALGASRPTVKVWFTVDARGRIVSKDMEPSGNPTMDSSVSRLLRNLRELPVPPGNRSRRFWVNMKVED